VVAPGGGGAGGSGPDDLRFRVLELRRDPAGQSSEVRSVPVQVQRIGDAQPTGDPAVVSVELETVAGGVRVVGSVDFSWTGSCRRCLGEAGGEGRTEFSELFVDDPQRWLAGDDDEHDDVHPIDQGWVDLTDVVRDAVLLGLPLAPLCKADCDGPAPGAFPVAVGDEDPARADSGDAGRGGGESGGEGSAESGGDPRWSKLSELRFDPSAD